MIDNKVIVGINGKIATGKSTFCNHIKNDNPGLVEYINLDDISKNIIPEDLRNDFKNYLEMENGNEIFKNVFNNLLKYFPIIEEEVYKIIDKTDCYFILIEGANIQELKGYTLLQIPPPGFVTGEKAAVPGGMPELPDWPDCPGSPGLHCLRGGISCLVRKELLQFY